MQSRSSFRSRDVLCESSDGSRLENKQMMLERQLKEKDELITKIMLNPYRT